MDLGNKNGELLKEWICIYNNRNLCKNQKGDTLNIENGFVEEGEYKISIKVTKGSMTKTASSTINVMKNVPSIEIDTVTSPIVPSSGFEIKANVEDVRTFCALQWKSEQRPYFIDLNEIPGNVSELVMVFVRRDLFLMEIEEYSNDVSHKNHDLKIPPPTEAKCPKIQLQENKIEVEYSQEILNDTLTVSALVEIDVNVPPKLQPLNVWPLQGVALETVFSFQTTKALVTGTEPPFLYKFGK
ncbi:hypothetical protein NQ315_007516 [Exocentrus adspersus]|uniref:PKD/REJ-like domain-containing protein n=1 Tax=Exocentrus adspersus TaxID=1586481 RepID=A0AAV8W7N5_9CUCU|nr:hypothetical protein NQ315_007516 [Exocentrus adspersus]